jgi:hypothetical protein
MRLLSEHKSILGGYPIGGIRVPGHEVDLVIGVLVAGVYRLEPGEVKGYRILAPTHLLVAGLPHDDVGELTRELQAKYPEDIVFVALSPEEKPQQAHLYLLTRDSGGQDFEVDLKPISGGIVRQTLSARPSNERCEILEFAVLDESAQVISISGFSVLIGQDLVSGVIVPLECDKENWLPRGEYRLRQKNPWIDSAILTPREFEVPGSLVVQLGGTFRRCRVICRDPGGYRVQPIVLSVLSSGIQREFTLARSDLEVWLPVGKVEIELRAFGYEARSFTFVVDKGDAPEQEFEVQSGPVVSRN